MTSLRSRLLGALLALLCLNGSYFAVGLKTVARMQQVNSALYDNVVMSSTYAQMAKNDFARYTEMVDMGLTELDARSRSAAWSGAADAASVLHDDLDVVKERMLARTDAESIKSLHTLLQEVDQVRSDLFQHARQPQGLKDLQAAHQWMTNSARLKALTVLSDLSDKVVADGYNYRLESEARSKFIEKVALAFSLAVLLINILVMGYILLSILPRLKLLAQTCTEIAWGSFEKNVEIHSRDEFGSLANSFNIMLEVIRDRESKLNDQLLTTSAMLDSLGQGFLIFGANGICRDVFSKSCFDLLEVMPAGKAIADVLKVSEGDRAMFDEWVRILFSDTIEFEDAAKLGPTEFKHSHERHIFLDYKAVYNLAGDLQSVVVIATDRTEALQAQRMVDAEQAFSKMVMRLMRNRREFIRLLARLEELIDQLPTQPLAVALRTLHNIKGAAGTYSLTKLAEAAHASETALVNLSEAEDSSSKLRSESAKVAEVYGKSVHELKKLSGLNLSTESARREFAVVNVLEFYQKLVAGGPALASFANDYLESFVMEPIAGFFTVYNDTLAQVALRKGKRIADLKFEGGDLPVLGEVYTRLFDSFVHVFRNAADHGAEPPDERLAVGKPESAEISIHFRKIDSHLEILVRDDGRGVDVERLRARLLERGIDCSSETDPQVLQRLFVTGFSTASEVSEISGRGIGLDAVLSEARRLGGEATIASELGRGTSIRVVVPYLDRPGASGVVRSA